MKFFTKWFTRVAEFIAAAMLAAMFVIFLLQIATRYSSKLAPSIPIEFISNYMSEIEPLRWTIELLLLLWLWIVFFGCAFIVRERDQVTFDILYLAAPRRVRQILAMISAIAVVIAMMWSLPATWDYIDWMKIRSAATLKNPFAGWGIPGLDNAKIPLRTVFSVYAIFMIAISIRYGWRFIDVWRNGPPDKDHEIPGHEADGPAIKHGDDAI